LNTNHVVGTVLADLLMGDRAHDYYDRVTGARRRAYPGRLHDSPTPAGDTATVPRFDDLREVRGPTARRVTRLLQQTVCIEHQPVRPAT